MFYGQIMMNGYLEDPAISFCAIGDASFDRAPLQITDFGQGNQLDQLISKIYLERGGGNNIQESYELAAFFYVNHCELLKSELPYFFITGDEYYYENITGASLSKIFGIHADKYNYNMNKISSSEIWSLLMKKFNVFHLHKNYKKQDQDEDILDHWVKALGRDRILEIKTPKACIDVILGAISMTSGARTLETYIDDMKIRGQTEERIQEVTNALKYVKPECHSKIVPKKINHKDLKHEQEKGKNNKTEEKVEEEELKENAFEKIYDLYFVQKFVRENLAHDEEKYTEEAIQKRNENEHKYWMEERFKCPITERMFIYPVKAADGNTYEENAIQMWLKFHSSSPLTGVHISQVLMPNTKIRNEIDTLIDPEAATKKSPKKKPKKKKYEKNVAVQQNQENKMTEEEIREWELALD